MTYFCRCCHWLSGLASCHEELTKLLRPTGRPRIILFLAAPATQIFDVAGPFQVFVRAAELFVHEYPAQKIPYTVLLASSTHRKSVVTN
jgi:hypothetical protein